MEKKDYKEFIETLSKYLLAHRTELSQLLEIRLKEYGDKYDITGGNEDLDVKITITKK